MYLYAKQDKHFDVYIMEEDEKLAASFREQEMETIPYFERVLCALQSKKLELFNYPKNSINERKIKNVLDNYYQGTYNSSFIKVIESSKGLKYLLFTKYNSQRAFQSNIINLTKLLYGYHHIINGDFTIIKDFYSKEEIIKLLELFKINKTREVPITDFYRNDSEFIKKTYEIVEEKSQKDAMALKLFKEYKK